VLEIGCGTGTTALHLAASVEHIHATDLSSGMLAIAQDKARQSGTQNVDFAEATLVDESLCAEDFDIVIAFNLLHLLEDLPDSIARAAELLKPDGLFISKTPCIGEANFLVRGLLPVLRAFGRAPYVNCVKEQELLELLEQANFQVVEAALYPKKTHCLFVVARKRDRQTRTGQAPAILS
jgi:predicted TPR repeat methyltransferase